MENLKFTGKGGEYFKIWIVNFLLIILTFGLYYPWAKVRTNRYFYANTFLKDRNFEYHATGNQLFIAYLIAFILFVIYSVSQEFAPILSLGLLALFFIALPWIIWRSLKFRHRVTSFSNVRFSFHGSLSNAYINYLLIPSLIVIVYAIAGGLIYLIHQNWGFSTPAKWAYGIIAFITTLSWAYIYALIKQRNSTYYIENSQYGQGKLSTNLQIWPFFVILMQSVGLWFLFFFIPWLVAAILSGVDFSRLTDFLKIGNAPAANGSGLGFLIAISYIALILGGIAIAAFITARNRKYIFENSRLEGQMKMASTLTSRKLAWVNVSNLILIILTLGIAYPWTKIRSARAYVDNTSVDTSIGFEQYLTQKMEEQSSLGEQIGDAFDVDVGF